MVRKYVSIILQRNDASEIIQLLKICEACERDDGYLKVIKCRTTRAEKKVAFIESTIEHLGYKSNNSFKNLLQILAHSASLKMLGKISQEVERLNNLNSGIHSGFIWSKNPIGEKDLIYHSERLSRMFGKSIVLSNKLSDKDELRISLNDLGYELVLSNQLIARKIKDFITKAI